jgi:hypothetical protein
MIMLAVEVKVINSACEIEGLEPLQHIYTLAQQICEVKAKKNCGTNQPSLTNKQEHHC